VSDVLLRDVPEPLLKALKDRADQHQQSVEGEVLTILESTLGASTSRDPIQRAQQIREQLAATNRSFSDSVDVLREDHER